MTKSFAMEAFHLFLFIRFLKSRRGGIFYFFPLNILVNVKLSFPSSISFSPFIFIFEKNLCLRFFSFFVYVLFTFIAFFSPFHCSLLTYMCEDFWLLKKIACLTFIIHLQLFHNVYGKTIL